MIAKLTEEEKFELAKRGREFKAIDDDVLGYTIQQLVLDAAVARAGAVQRTPLDDAQALKIARKHLDQGLTWEPHTTRCTDLEIRALIRAVEEAHGIGDA